ncbi:MAG: DUF4363 family protein [Clostridia bacterium]|jgi:hypothetical protein|nr:DUF4363 family protein [Clostridia bacterium]MDD4275395.1 DUF4363 family protein [Clostridia bacterium]
MKKLIFLFISITILVTFAWVDCSLFNKSINNLTNELAELVVAIDDTTGQINTFEITEKYDLLHSKWEKSETDLIMFIDFIQLEQIGVGLARVETYIEENDITETKAEINAVKHLCEKLKKRTAFNFENIL